MIKLNSQTSKGTQMILSQKLEQLENAKEFESKQLRAEIFVIRSKLQSVQAAYSQITDDVRKEELCKRLGQYVLAAQEDISLLQHKCSRLQLIWKSQEDILLGMQMGYEEIQQKFKNLQKEYENLDIMTIKPEEHTRLVQNKNASLQNEISTLKELAGKAQNKLLWIPYSCELKTQNVQLKEHFEQLQLSYNELQSTYDDLSSNLMESIQEGDTLRNECDKLRLELKKVTSEYVCQQCCDCESLKSSGIYTENSEPYSDSHLELMRLMMELDQQKTKNSEQANTIKTIQEKMQNLEADLKQESAAKFAAELKIETLNCNISDLSEELHQTKNKASNFEKHYSLQEKQLEKRLEQAQQDAISQNKITEKLRLDLEFAQNEKPTLSNNQSQLAERIQKLERTIIQYACQFQHSIQNLHSSQGELKVKLDSLQHDTLLNHIDLTVEEANKSITGLHKLIEMGQQLVKEITTECKKLLSVSKNVERSQKNASLDDSISRLLEQKDKLEEEVINKKLHNDFNILQKQSHSGKVSLGIKKCFDRDSTLSKEEVRRYQRIITHDERRRQSYWNDFRDVDFSAPLSKLQVCPLNEEATNSFKIKSQPLKEYDPKTEECEEKRVT